MSERYTAAGTTIWYVLITTIRFVVTTSFVIHCRLSPDATVQALLAVRFLKFALASILVLTIPILVLT